MAASLLMQGNSALRNKQYENAIDFYRAAAVANPLIRSVIEKNIETANRIKNRNQIDLVPLAKDVSIDIVVPVFNALDDVKSCLSSLELNADGLNIKIVVVNDGSDVETTNWLRSHCGNNCLYILIEHEKNFGYTKAINSGLRATKGDFIVTQNSDTVVTAGWLNGLIRCFQSDPTIGIVGPLSNAASWQNVPNLRDEFGGFAVNSLPADFSAEDMAKIVRNVSLREYPRVPFVNGFCFMIKREVIAKIGYMDEENFPIGYGEENDFCIRAMDAGFSLAIADDVYVFHAKSKSFGHERRKSLSEQGSRNLINKHSIEKINSKIEELKKNIKLDGIRLRLQENFELKNNFELSDLSLLFVLPVAGDGGGIHSIIQEVGAMRDMGVTAKVATSISNREKYLSNYPGVSNIDEFFDFYSDIKSLLKISNSYDCIIATTYSSVKYVRTIKEHNNNHIFCYYIQDYEPLFFEEGSDKYVEAFESYTLVEGMICFAKTNWIIDKVNSLHHVLVHKVSPSIDHDVYCPLPKLRSNVVNLSAMIRPSTPRRGADRTLRLLARLKEQFKDKIQINIFGCDNLSLKKSTDFGVNLFKNHGVLKREGVADVLKNSDIFIDLSDYQAFGRTALEAMACGATVVITKFGGVDEFMVHHENGILVDPFNEEDAFIQVSALLTSSGLLNRFRLNAIQTASNFTIKKSAISELMVLLKNYLKSTYLPILKRSNSLRVALMPCLMGNGRPAGSAYVRLINPYSLMEFSNCIVLERSLKSLPRPGAYDVVFMQRDMAHINLDEFVAWAASWKASGGRIVYDIDDDLTDIEGVMLRTKRNRAEAEKLASRVRLFASSANIVTVSMPSLVPILSNINKNVSLIYNCIDEKSWCVGVDRAIDFMYSKKEYDPIRIGYIGTPTHDKDLEIIIPAIKKIEAEFAGKVVFEVIGAFGSNPPSFGQKIALPKKTEYPNFVEWLVKRVNWDIGLIPIADDNFNKSKSFLKFTEYSALGLAIVCSATENYNLIANDSVNCLVAKNQTNDWYVAIKKLILNSELRKRLAMSASEDLINKYTTRASFNMYSELIDKVR